jgi:hypothetical protein
MDAPILLWEAWRTQVEQLFPHLHGHQQKTLAWMILGMVLSHGMRNEMIQESR